MKNKFLFVLPVGLVFLLAMRNLAQNDARFEPVAPSDLGGVQQSEQVVSELVFGDCAEYVLDDKTPFDDRDLLPLNEFWKDVIATRPVMDQAYFIDNTRYGAAWGGSEDSRICIVFTNNRSAEARFLGVQGKGFSEFITNYARDAGFFAPQRLDPASSRPTIAEDSIEWLGDLTDQDRIGTYRIRVAYDTNAEQVVEIKSILFRMDTPGD